MAEIEKKRGRRKVPRLVSLDRLSTLIDFEENRLTIADSIGCDVSTITKHYNGDNPVDLEMLYKYAQYFDVSTDYLLGISDIPNIKQKEKDVLWLVEKNAELQTKLVTLSRQLYNSEDRASRLNALVDEMYSYLVRIGKNKEFSLEHDLREKQKAREVEKCGRTQDVHEKNNR